MTLSGCECGRVSTPGTSVYSSTRTRSFSKMTRYWSGFVSTGSVLMDHSVRVDLDALTTTRRSLHGVAETLLAGPEHRAIGRIRLRVVPGGFTTLTLTGPVSRIAVLGSTLVVHPSDGAPPRTVRLEGTFAEVAAAAGLSAGAPQGVYPDGSDVGLDEQVTLDPAALATLNGAFAVGDQALRRLVAAHHADDDGGPPVLWPEHFDVGVTLDEVNFGVSPGDAGIAEPYAYVSPWKRRGGDFWDQPFGSARRLSELGDADDVLSYLEAGRARAATDPLV